MQMATAPIHQYIDNSVKKNRKKLMRRMLYCFLIGFRMLYQITKKSRRTENNKKKHHLFEVIISVAVNSLIVQFSNYFQEK